MIFWSEKKNIEPYCSFI